MKQLHLFAELLREFTTGQALCWTPERAEFDFLSGIKPLLAGGEEVGAHRELKSHPAGAPLGLCTVVAMTPFGLADLEKETQRWVLKDIETFSRLMSEAERVLAQGIVYVEVPNNIFCEGHGVSFDGGLLRARGPEKSQGKSLSFVTQRPDASMTPFP